MRVNPSILLVNQLTPTRGQARVSWWETLLLYARTVQYLEPVQIYSRFRPLPRPTLPRPLPALRPVTGSWSPPIPRNSAQLGPNRFIFLNEEREVASWNDSSAPKLWLYNLNYFDHTEAPLVERWIAENPAGQGVAWDPYPTSLRVSNWCKWLLSGVSTDPVVHASIATQAAWIEKRLERHLLANHLLANAKALLFAGSVYEGKHPDRWRAIGLRILQQELPRQILADGAHVERSPMYHSIVLEDLLDLCNLSRAFDGLLPDFTDHASRMLGWLEQMTHPDGDISFFNDAAHGIAPQPSVLQSYALDLGVASVPMALNESGYARLENEDVVLLFDAAPLGPDYQPGHGHADTLSFELSFRGERVLVNTGTFTYEPGRIRSFDRGTAAHNTVRVDGIDQSEMWGIFRVARRGRPFAFRTDARSFVEAAHDGYQRLSSGIIHWRRIELNGSTVMITDSLIGRGRHTAEVFYHLAPGAHPDIHLDCRLIRKEIPSVYHHGFNRSIPNRTIVGHWSGECPAHFQTTIELSKIKPAAAAPMRQQQPVWQHS